jgi:TolB-like protein/cytochrome c-type biogenesis protein CcmH/NrfG
VGVLAFENMSPDGRDDWFSDGLTEQIITALSHVEGLRVAARTSSFALRGRGLGARAIGDTLDVETVLEGSVRRDGNNLRVTAQLVDAATGYHIWSDQYDRRVADVFAVQDEIANEIAGALQLRTTRRPAPSPGSDVPSLEAYDLYLRGLYLRNSMSGDALRQAADFFDRAIELEPEFALAWAGKASVLGPLIYFAHVPVDEGTRELRELTARALELDPSSGEAYTVLGMQKLFFEWDWDSAEKALRRAIELNPSDAHAWHHLANYHGAVSRPADAAAVRERAVQLDPLNVRTRFALGIDYVAAGDSRRAMEHFRRAIQLDPVHPLALGIGPGMPAGPASAYLQEGRVDEAIGEYLKVAALRGATESELDAMRSAYASSGITAFWKAWLDMDVRQSAASPNSLRMAATWALIGDTTQAFRWLDRAWAERNPGLIFVRHDPAFESVRSHPRFTGMVSAMKFPAEPVIHQPGRKP